MPHTDLILKAKKLTNHRLTKSNVFSYLFDGCFKGRVIFLTFYLMYYLRLVTPRCFVARLPVTYLTMNK